MTQKPNDRLSYLFMKKQGNTTKDLSGKKKKKKGCFGGKRRNGEGGERKTTGR